MNIIVKAFIIILFTALSMAGCSSGSGSSGTKYNSPQSQKADAEKAQRELSSETK